MDVILKNLIILGWDILCLIISIFCLICFDKFWSVGIFNNFILMLNLFYFLGYCNIFLMSVLSLVFFMDCCVDCNDWVEWVKIDEVFEFEWWCVFW